MRFNPRALLFALAAPVGAILFALVLTAVLLLATGNNPFDAFAQMIDYASQPRTQVLIINASVYYYLSAVAVAISFRMNLFNIGVDGQYRIAAIMAAGFAGYVPLPPVVGVFATIAVAMLVGAMWAGIAGLLRAYRGVSEVISTIMLNFIATAVIAFLLVPGRFAEPIAEGTNQVSTPLISENARVPGIPLVPDAGLDVNGFLVVAVLVGFLYWFVLSRTRFGFDLRATGMSESAAVASGVNVKRMIVVSMLVSGACAGLVGMPILMGETYRYSLEFPGGLGFTGIAIALLGRNNAVGIAFAALLWAFLDQSAAILDLSGIPSEVVKIVQGVVVLAVVIAYELQRRWKLRQVAAEVAAKQRGSEQEGVPA
jgi:simple sugar transport system permease protein